MIKASELRIGNLIAMPVDSGKPFWKVLETKELGVIYGQSWETGTGYCKYEIPSAIPLTPEWLERCGFKKTMFTYPGDPKTEAVEAFVNGGFVVRFINIIDRKGYKAEWFPYPQSQNSLPGWIDYVHQLQNKYYDWTDGEELAITNLVS